ncbi:MAG: hypothetical protein P1U67_08950 [Alcanivoracaceae bacterium]|nr:hypothetical protein [Alcanivoracaceae bacterium]
MKAKLFFIALAMVSTQALADITANYKASGGHNMAISYRDDSHIRLNIDSGKGTYVLLAEGNIYMVNKDGNQWVATDLSQMKQFMANMPFGKTPAAKEKSDSDFEFVDTGRTETVAGYDGKVYEILDKTNGKKYETVLSGHEDIANLYRALISLSKQMVNDMGLGNKMPELPSSKGGLLRQGNDFVLTGVDKGDKGEGYFQLPAGVVMRDFGAMMGSIPMPTAEDMKNIDPRALEMMKKMQR